MSSVFVAELLFCKQNYFERTSAYDAVGLLY